MRWICDSIGSVGITAVPVRPRSVRVVPLVGDHVKPGRVFQQEIYVGAPGEQIYETHSLSSLKVL